MWKQYLITPLCLKCGSFLCNESLFCRICFEQEIDNLCRSHKNSHISSHLYLLSWEAGKSDVLSRMVYRMKSDRSVPAWRFYAEKIYVAVKDKIDFSEYVGLVPIPGSKQNSVHAWLLARELSRQTGLEVLDLLCKPHAGEQKKRTAEERKSGVGIHRKRYLPEHFTRLIFVDDILTTGESFRQSCRALNCSEDSPVITLFYRPKTGLAAL